MRWEVRGANRNTGDDVVTVITATSEGEAERIARSEGVLVSSVMPEQQQVDALSQLAAAAERRHLTPQRVAATPPMQPPVPPQGVVYVQHGFARSPIPQRPAH